MSTNAKSEILKDSLRGGVLTALVAKLILMDVTSAIDLAHFIALCCTLLFVVIVVHFMPQANGKKQE